MKSKKHAQDEPLEAKRLAEVRFLEELEQLLHRLPPHMSGEVVGKFPGRDGSLVRPGMDDIALPFLIFVDTRRN